MSNSLGTVSINDVAKDLLAGILAERDRLVKSGMSLEAANFAINRAVNNWSWDMATNPSPLGEKGSPK